LQLLLSVGREVINRYLLPGAPTTANPLQQCVEPNDGTDRETDTRLLHRPCSTYYARGVKNMAATTKFGANEMSQPKLLFEVFINTDLLTDARNGSQSDVKTFMIKER